MDDDGEDLLGGKIEEARLDPGCVSRMHPVAFGQLLSAVIFTPNGREGTPDVRTSTYTADEGVTRCTSPMLSVLWLRMRWEF